MTTLSFNDATSVSFFASDRAPSKSYAARLAALQAARQQAPHLSVVFGAAARAAAAAIPVCALAYLFVFI